MNPPRHRRAALAPLTCLAFATHSASAHAAVVSLAPSADAYVRADVPANAGGLDNDHELILGSNANPGTLPFHGLLRFDDFTPLTAALLPGESIQVHNVTLALTTRSGVSDGGTGVMSLSLHDYGFDFGETTATFNDPDGDGNNATGDTTPGGTPGAALATTASVGNDPGDAVLFASSPAFVADAQAAVNTDGTLNYLITNDATLQSFIRFASRERAGTDPVPTLTIDYDVVVPEPATAAPLALAVALLTRRRRAA